MPSSKPAKPETNRTGSKPPTPGTPIIAALSERFDLAAHRRYLGRDLEGVILDLGAGSGSMIPYLQTAVQREPALRLRAIERATASALEEASDRGRRRQTKRTATTHDPDIHVRSGRAESLPYADDTFDAVIASAVFCTVQDPFLALEEVHRVVKPDGEFRFLEHVRSDGLCGYSQDAVTPLWKRIDDGCHLDPRTDDWITASPVALDEIETLRIGVSPSRPSVHGAVTPTRRAGTDGRIERRERLSSPTSTSSSDERPRSVTES